MVLALLPATQYTASSPRADHDHPQQLRVEMLGRVQVGHLQLHERGAQDVKRRPSGHRVGQFVAPACSFAVLRQSKPRDVMRAERAWTISVSHRNRTRSPRPRGNATRLYAPNGVRRSRTF